MELKDTFIQLVRELKDKKLEDLSKVLLSKGYGLTEDQMKVMSEVFDALKNSKEKKKKVNFLIRGTSGSGKSLLAVTLYLEALSRGNLILPFLITGALYFTSTIVFYNLFRNVKR